MYSVHTANFFFFDESPFSKAGMTNFWARLFAKEKLVKENFVVFGGLYRMVFMVVIWIRWNTYIRANCCPTFSWRESSVLGSSRKDIDYIEWRARLRLTLIYRFLKLLQIYLKNSHLLFNSQLYKQCGDISMGFVLGPLFASIFVSFHEITRSNKLPKGLKPVFFLFVSLLVFFFVFCWGFFLIDAMRVDGCFLFFRVFHHVQLSQ